MRTLIAALIVLVAGCADMAPVCPGEADGGAPRYVGVAGPMNFDEAVEACGELAAVDGSESILAMADACRDALGVEGSCWTGSTFEQGGVVYAWVISTSGPSLAPVRTVGWDPGKGFAVVCESEGGGL